MNIYSLAVASFPAFPRFVLSIIHRSGRATLFFTALPLYTEHKPKNKTGEAWEQSYSCSRLFVLQATEAVNLSEMLTRQSMCVCVCTKVQYSRIICLDYFNYVHKSDQMMHIALLLYWVTTLTMFMVVNNVPLSAQGKHVLTPHFNLDSYPCSYPYHVTLARVQRFLILSKSCHTNSSSQVCYNSNPQKKTNLTVLVLLFHVPNTCKKNCSHTHRL